MALCKATCVCQCNTLACGCHLMGHPFVPDRIPEASSPDAREGEDSNQ